MRTAVIATLGCMLAAGCGGGPAATAPEATAARFTREANAICVAFDRNVEDLGTPKSLPQLVTYFDRWKPRLRAALLEIRRVPVPADRSDRFYGWVDDTGALLATVDEIRDAAARGDARTVQSKGAELEKASRSLDRIARSLGLSDCTG
jgi:hypothetical protein